MLRFLFLVILVFTPLLGAEEKSDLYVSEVDESAGAKPLKMRLEEIERAPRYSIVQVTQKSGASVPSIMFVMRGMWEMARARNTAYFINLKEWTTHDGKWLYKVGFADSDPSGRKRIFWRITIRAKVPLRERICGDFWPMRVSNEAMQRRPKRSNHTHR